VPKNCASPAGGGGGSVGEKKITRYSETLPANCPSDVLETTGPSLGDGDGDVSFWRRRSNTCRLK
jgi:hypothetical protein